MKVNVINANHVELEFTPFPLFLKTCFSYRNLINEKSDLVVYLDNDN